MGTKQIAVAPKKMHVGYNYGPWNLYGNYLGHPGDWGRQWTENLATNLKRLKEIGIDVIRIFLLGNASNYDTNILSGDRLSDPVVDQLHKMFKAVKDAKCRIIPSIIDFKAFGHRMAQTAPVIPSQTGAPIDTTSSRPQTSAASFWRLWSRVSSTSLTRQTRHIRRVPPTQDCTRRIFWHGR